MMIRQVLRRRLPEAGDLQPQYEYSCIRDASIRYTAPVHRPLQPTGHSFRQHNRTRIANLAYCHLDRHGHPILSVYRGNAVTPLRQRSNSQRKIY